VTDDPIRRLREQKRRRKNDAVVSETPEPAERPRVNLVSQGARLERVRREPTPDDLLRAARDQARGRPRWTNVF
jgi:hypothetical protein